MMKGDRGSSNISSSISELSSLPKEASIVAPLDAASPVLDEAFCGGSVDFGLGWNDTLDPEATAGEEGVR